MGLTAATYLGDNTVPILRDLAGILGLDFDETAPRSSPDARRDGSGHALVWICGHLTMKMLAEGALSAEVVAAPIFAGEGAARYRSVIVARRGGPTDLASALRGRMAINETESWSGHLGLRSFLADRGWFATESISGSHRESIAMVASGGADVAGIDHTIWDHVCAQAPAAVQDLHVIATTDDWPAPPFSVSTELDEPIRTQLIDALVGVDCGQVPGLDGIVAASPSDYEPLAG